MERRKKKELNLKIGEEGKKEKEGRSQKSYFLLVRGGKITHEEGKKIKPVQTIFFFFGGGEVGESGGRKKKKKKLCQNVRRRNRNPSYYKKPGLQ